MSASNSSMVCSFANCHRRRKSHGLCNGHNEQRRLGKTLTAIVPRRGRWASLTRDPLGRKWCKQCEQWLHEDAFSRSTSRIDGLYFHCKECERNAQLGLRYGLTRDRYNAMFAAQGERCAVCKSADPGVKGWCVDHDHSCCGSSRACSDCVRGILCHGCNTAIGLLGDSPEVVVAAAAYLWRAGLKGGSDVEDLRKAVWYINDEITRLEQS